MGNAWGGFQDWAIFIGGAASGGFEVKGESPTNGTTLIVSQTSGPIAPVQEPTATAASGNLVALIDNAPNRVMVRDLQGMVASEIVTGGDCLNLAIGGTLVAWEEELAGVSTIRATSVLPGTIHNVGVGSWPSVDGTKIYYEEANGIASYDVLTSVQTSVATNIPGTFAYHHPSAAGGIVAFERESLLTGGSVIERSDGTTRTDISTSLCSNAYQPRVGGVSGDLVVYMADNCVPFQDSFGNWYGGAGRPQLLLAKWNSTTSTVTTYFLGEFAAIPDPDRQPWYDIEGDRIAYTLDGATVEVINLL